jgi:hypothetical protein
LPKSIYKVYLALVNNPKPSVFKSPFFAASSIFAAAADSKAALAYSLSAFAPPTDAKASAISASVNPAFTAIAAVSAVTP